MKLVRVTFQFQFQEAIERILLDRRIRDYVIVPHAEGRDRDGRHDNSQAFPGYSALAEAAVEDDEVSDLLAGLRRFRDDRAPHHHVRAYVVAVERSLDDV